MPLEKTLTFHNVIILIKSVFNKVKNDIFLEKIHINNIHMLYYDTIEVSEGTDINKTSAPKECDICGYWYILDKAF